MVRNLGRGIVVGWFLLSGVASGCMGSGPSDVEGTGAGVSEPNPGAGEGSPVKAVCLEAEKPCLPDPFDQVLKYDGCMYHTFVVEAPEQDVQKILPPGYRPLGILAPFDEGDKETGTLFLDVLDCEKFTVNETVVLKPFQLALVYAFVSPPEDVPPQDFNMYVFELFLPLEESAPLYQLFQAMGFPVESGNISVRPDAVPGATKYTVQVTVDGSPRYWFPEIREDEPPAWVLSNGRTLARGFHVNAADGSTIWLDQENGGSDSERASLYPSILEVHGGVLGKLGTGALGEVPGVTIVFEAKGEFDFGHK